MKQRHKKSINGLKRSKRLDSLISYYQVLQYDTAVAGKYNESRLRKLGKYKPLSNNKKLKKLVKRAWDGKLQVLHLSWVIDFRRDGHAVLLLPFVKDKMAKKGYYELRAYDPDSPGKMIKIRIKRNGEVSVPSYFKHMRENPIDIVQFATRDWPWVSRNINGK